MGEAIEDMNREIEPKDNRITVLVDKDEERMKQMEKVNPNEFLVITDELLERLDKGYKKHKLYRYGSPSHHKEIN